jgi:YesN/AraC family two-component response regulator
MRFVFASKRTGRAGATRRCRDTDVVLTDINMPVMDG